METNPTQLRLASITYGSGLEEHHLYDYDHHSGEILELLTSLPDSATFRITRIDFNLIGAAERKAADKLDETRETLERMEERLSNTRQSFLEALEEIGSLKEEKILKGWDASHISDLERELEKSRAANSVMREVNDERSKTIKSYEDRIRNQCLEQMATDTQIAMNLALSLLMVQREVLEREHNDLTKLHLSKGNELAIKALTRGGEGGLDDLMHEYNIYKTTATGGHKQ